MRISDWSSDVCSSDLFAHVLAEDVQALFPGTQITFGTSTDDGFYYDFAPRDRPFTDEDLPAIEAKMRELIAADKPLRRDVGQREGRKRVVSGKSGSDSGVLGGRRSKKKKNKRP